MIERPKKVSKIEKGYLTNEKYQDYAESQFKTIYDYLDGMSLDLKDCKISGGSTVRGGLGTNRIAVFSINEVNKMFGTNVNSHHFIAIFNNGDGNANSKRILGATWQGTTLYAELDSTNSINMRINYLIIYIP